MEKRKLYLLIACTYIGQGILYQVIFTFLPTLFEVHGPALGLTIDLQSIFIIGVQLQYLVKVGFSLRLDQKRKRGQVDSGGGFHATVLQLICLYFGLMAGILFLVSIENIWAYLGAFILLSYGIAVQDATVDDQIIRGTTPEERVRLSSTYNIAYVFGGLFIFNLFLLTLSPVQGDLGAWALFLRTASVAVAGAAALAFFLKRDPSQGSGEKALLPQEKSTLGNSVPNHEQTEVEERTNIEPEEIIFIKQGTKIAKRDYVKKILPIILALAIFINIGVLSEYTFEQYIVREFGQEGFSYVVGYKNVAMWVSLVSYLLYIACAKIFAKYYIPVLKGTAALFMGYWIFLPYLALEIFAVATLLKFVLGTFLVVSVSLIFMDYAPSHQKATGFQLFSLVYFLPVLFLPVVGTYMAAAWGDAVVFTIIGLATLIVLGLLIGLERRVKALKRL